MKRKQPARFAVCGVCKRRIRLIKHSGHFRRHMSSPGVVCEGAWRSPAETEAT